VPTKNARGKAAVNKRAKLKEVVDLTSKDTIAGKHISVMDASDIEAVVTVLHKTAKKNGNRVIKEAVIEVAYADACHKAFVKHLQQSQHVVSSMVHPKRPTIVEQQGLLATIKIGDWIEVESDYSLGMLSDGGIGCVYGLHMGDDEVQSMRVEAVDVHYIVDNRRERGVLLKRCVVIPMPFKLDKVNLRPKTKPKEVTKAPPPIKTPLEWLKYGTESKLNKKQG
jgi:hypothetical protein